jgi:outer membrane protein assembly factor BamB
MILLLFLTAGISCKRTHAKSNPVPDAGSDRFVFAGDAVRFDASGTCDPNARITGLHWDFDNSDGVGSDAATWLASHSYNTPGTYYVTLVVEFGDSECAADVATVTVMDAGLYWPQVHHNAACAGMSASSVPQTENIAWSADVAAVQMSAPVVCHNSAFVYSIDTDNLAAYVKAVELECGSVVWTAPVDYPTDTWTTSSPAYADGFVFALSNSSLYALDAWTGEVRWQRALSGYTSNCSPAVADGLVFVGTDSTGDVYAFDLYNGDELWKHTFPGAGHADTKPAVYGGYVFIGGYYSMFDDLGCNGIISLYIDNGSEVWFAPTTYGVMGSMSIVNGRLWATDYNFAGPGNLYSMHLENGGVITTTAITSTDVAPTYLDGKIYVCGGITAWGVPQTFQAIDADNGDVLATENFGGFKCSLAAAPGVIICGDINVAGTGCDAFHVYDAAAGTVLWSGTCGGGCPAIAAGRIYSIGSDGKIYCHK